jgi:gluconolactonase
MSPLVDLRDVQQVAQGIDHAEGICRTPDGTVYVSGEKGQIYRLEADDSATEVATTGGWTLGLAADTEGRIYACDAVRRAVLRWAPGDPEPVVWTSGAPEAPFRSPNWGAFGPDGSYYVSDSGAWKGRDGNVQVVRGGRASVWTAESVDFPNGLTVTPDGAELWVLESTPGRLVAFDIRADGSAGPRRVLAELPGTVPDGIAFATDGSILIACYRPDVVYRWRADLGLEVVAEDPEGTVLAAPTNCAFVGPDLDIVAVPNIGRWHVSRFRVPGLIGVPLFYPNSAQLGEAGRGEAGSREAGPRR